MSLPKEVRDAVIHLSGNSKQFRILMEYWKRQDDLYVSEILSPMTDMATREVGVRVRAILNREVIGILERAMKEAEQPETKE